MLTDARLAEIRDRHAATTPGTWALDGPYYWPGDDDPHVSSVAVDTDRMPVLLPAPGNKNGEADLAFAVHAHQDVTELVAEVERLRAHILDIDAHATPYGDIPDDPGYVGIYLVTAGALHRALGKVGHCAPSCQAEAERDALRAELERRDQADAEALADQTLVKGLTVEDGTATLSLIPPREIAAVWAHCAKGMLGDAPNYSETPVTYPSVSMEVIPAGEPERYALIVQRVGKLTPHEARQRAEAERDEALAELKATRQDAARWRRVEPLIERSHRHAYHLDPVDLLNVAADDTEEAPDA
ncbi:hypothetical protein ABT340_39300 [Streptosporangium sp. NPDC000239]|uniref:hypothetical protein n=1 Tax=Streptosporangium sp. NPDC000239 TaxID=3154248 RepID=UPI00332AFA84